MEPERWRQVEELFFALLEEGEPARASRLAAARAGDPELAREAEAMLAAHESPASAAIERFLLERRPAGGTGEAGGIARIGRRAGAFRLIERIGQGGMGEVYLAERADGAFRQRVAVKLLRAGLQGAEAEARFRAEREILARLEHPGIARLLDGGLTEEGLPYLALEYIRGEAITRWCDGRSLPLGDRLRLFLQVCRAVRFAHQRLIVHRDLKPSNLLVTEEGEVKLLDFGIAKLLEGEDEGARTRTGVLLLTPEYASPEQIRGEPVTTSTDVYALGLLLYELLTGRRAQPIADSSPLGVARSVCETVPLKPSLAVREAGEGDPLDPVTPEERAVRRGAPSTEALARQLRGDLDILVARALHKDAGRRYASVEALAGDLERHLDGFPIEARGDSLGYRTGKLLRRHRWTALASAVALAALVLGLTFALLGLVRARRAEAAARRDAETSRQVSSLLVGIFEVNDPGEARGETVTARELLDRGAERVRTQLAGSPEVQGNLLRTMGEAYLKLGLYARAEEQYEHDLAVRRAAGGPAGPEVARSLVQLSGIAGRRGDYRRSRRLGEEALALFDRGGGPGAGDGVERMRALQAIGVARSNLGELSGARRQLEGALAIAERELKPDEPELATILNDLAITAWRLNDLGRARSLYGRSLGIFERRYGERHPSVANTLNNLALVDFKAGRYESARRLHERALAIRRAILAPDHPDVLESLNNLGNTLLALDPAAARPMLELALAARERVLGPDHPFLAATLCNLGIARARLGDPRAARPLLERSVAILQRSLGPDHVDLTYPLEILAQVYRNIGDLPAADRASARVLALREKAPGSIAPAQLKSALLTRARLLQALGRRSEALALEKRAAAL